METAKGGWGSSIALGVLLAVVGAVLIVPTFVLLIIGLNGFSESDAAPIIGCFLVVVPLAYLLLSSWLASAIARRVSALGGASFGRILVVTFLGLSVVVGMLFQRFM